MDQRKYGRSVWVLGLDYGPEGKQVPLTVFTSFPDAVAAQSIMSASNGTHTYLQEVPFWPVVREDN